MFSLVHELIIDNLHEIFYSNGDYPTRTEVKAKVENPAKRSTGFYNNKAINI